MLDYALIDISIRADISLPDGSEVLEIRDVVGFTSSFPMNSIPSATLSVAVGALADALQTKPQYASIHLLQTHLITRAKVRVFLYSQLKGSLGAQRTLAGAIGSLAAGGIRPRQALTELGVPADGTELLIFEGNVAGVGRALSAAGTAVATIYLEHWLANLNYASALSASSDPGNPSDMKFSAVFRALSHTQNASGQAIGPVSWVPMAARELVNEPNLDDIWSNILYEWMLATTRSDPFAIEVAQAGITTKGDVAPILDAINRLKKNEDGMALEITDEGGLAGAGVVNGIRTSLIKQTGANWINTTLWGKLIGEWAPEYFFSVVPRVSDGLIVPFAGPLSGKPWAVIGSEDYIFAKTDVSSPQLLRGVAIIHPSGVSSGFNQLHVGSINIGYGGFGGLYLSKHTTTGMLLIKYPPAWLANQYRAGQSSGRAERGKNAIETVYDADDEIIPDGDINGEQEKSAVKEIRHIMNLYARNWYSIERLKGRNGEVSGKLRFDICPGSNIRVEPDTSVGAGSAVSLIQAFYATVTQVNYVLDVEGMRAGTSFMLSHVHTEEEHSDEGLKTDFVTNKPAIYQNAWRGAAMIHGIKPEQ